MSRSYVIDGYNALYKLYDPVPEDPDASRQALVRRAHARLRTDRGGRRGGDRVHLVFDTRKGGTRGGSHGRDGPVSWSYAEGSADDAIVDIVRRNEGTDEGMDIVVVTDDRELRGRVKQLGASACRVHAWFDDEAEPPPDDDESAERRTKIEGKPFTAADFGMTDAPIDLDAPDSGDD